MMKQPLILAVDDEEALLKLLRINLSVDGYNVITAADGEQALEILDAHSPDLIILDIMMPDTDGFKILEMIRERSNVPVIILTAKSEISFLQHALFEGADDYVTKPFDLQILSARIKAKLRRAGKPQPVIAHRPAGRNWSNAITGLVLWEQKLTELEVEILNSIANGTSNRQIASELNITEQTVKNHVTTILRKLQVKNRAHAVIVAMRRGLILEQA